MTQVSKPDKSALFTRVFMLWRQALEDERALASNHVNIIRVREQNPVYIGVVLNSIIGRWQARRDCAGSAQVEIYPSDIRQFVIPFVDKAIEDEIVSNVESSHFARRRAKRLSEVAKRAVKIAIE